MEDVTQAAPAQPTETPAPITAPVAMPAPAEFDADFTAYRDTRRAERAGTPAPAPPAAPVAEPTVAPVAPVEEPRQVSKRQQQINAYERRIAEQEQRIRALETGSATPATPPAAPRTAPVAGETFPAYAQYLETHPDASLEDYIDARQDWRDETKARATAAQRRESERTQSERTDLEAAQARTLAARAADPALDALFKTWELPDAELPEILTIRTRAQAIAAQEIPLAINDFASAVASSDYNAQIVYHVAQHPEVLDQIRALPNRTAVNKFVGKLETRFEKAADTAPAPVPPKTISSAPTPGTALGTRPASTVDPVTAAVKGGDFTAFRAAKRARESATRR